MTDDTRPDLDQLQLQAGQRPVGHGLGQLDAAQECGQVVGQRVQLQPHLIVAELPAGQARPAEGVFAFLDVLLGGAALVVEPDHPVWLHRQVGDYEADTREQFARVPFDLGDDAAFLVPGRRLILEVLVEALDLGQRRPPDRARQPMRDLLAQDVVRRQPDGLEEPGFFQSLIDLGDRVGGVGPEEASTKVALRVAGDDGVENVPPAIGAVDVAMAQGAALQHA